VTDTPPARGEVWLQDPARQLQGREQTGARPVLIVSADLINRGPSRLAIVVPFTTRNRGIALHVPVDPPEGGLRQRSVLLPEQVHTTARERLVERWGRVSTATLRQIEDRLRVVLDLDQYQ